MPRSPNSCLQRTRVDDRARQEVRAGLLALVDDGERYVAEALGGLGIIGEQLPESDRARKPRGPRADHEHTDLDAFVDRVGRLGDERAGAKRRREVRRARHVAIASVVARAR